MVKKKTILKTISTVLVSTMLFNSCLTAFAGYNGGSTTSNPSSSKDGSGANYVNRRNQWIKCSLYFCPMPGVLMDNSEQSRKEMDKQWAKGTGIQQIGESIYILNRLSS